METKETKKKTSKEEFKPFSMADMKLNSFSVDELNNLHLCLMYIANAFFSHKGLLPIDFISSSRTIYEFISKELNSRYESSVNGLPF